MIKGKLGLPDEVREKIRKSEIVYQNAFDIFETPYLIINISAASELPIQIEAAAKFLKHHLHDLNKLRYYPNVENTLIQFLVEPNESKTDFQDFPDEFSNLYSSCGIQNILIREATYKH